MNLVLLSLVILIKLFFVKTLDLDKYLDEKLRQSKIEIIKIHIQEISPVQEKSYRLQWEISLRIPLITEHRPLTIHMFDGIFILDGNRVTSFNDTSLNETSLLRQDDQIEEDPVVKFVRSIIWKNTIIYLLVCYENGLCNLHTGTRNETLRFRHTIGNRGIPVDAKFFTQGDRVYLIVANNAEKFSVPSMIYRWSGTYMDVVSDVMTIGAISVTTFEHKQSTIIVFAQSDGENPRISSEVYEFKGNNIIRIQFLLTNKPISVHHYVHGDFNFILMMNELEPSKVLCWDGQELLDWFTLSEIEPHSLISIFHMDGDTFVIVAHDNIIQLYKFHSASDWKNENVKYFEDSKKIIDMAVSIKNYTMTMVLIIMEENVYWVEQWEVEIASLSNDGVVIDTDTTRKCLSDLIEKLQMRMMPIKEAEASWEYLLPSTKNLTKLEPIKFDNLILEAGTVQQINIVTEKEEILPPHQIQESLNKLDSNINDILSEWQRIVNTTVSEILKGNIIVDDAFLDELQIDKMHVDFVNDEDIRSEDIIFPENEEEFVNPLRAKRIVAHNLEVDSLCGIPSQYWRLQNNATNIFTFENDSVEYSNGTVIIHSDVTVSKLNIKNLNGTVIDQLIDDLFIINSTNKITGEITYKNVLHVTNLTTQMLNGIPADKLMTIATNQSFDDFYVKILDIENLQAETIKGVRVNEAARKSRINVIKGEIKLAKLHVTENLTIDVNSSLVVLPKDKPLQIYENVTILGDLHLQNIQIRNTATLFMQDVQLNIKNIFNVFWTKSTNQTITREINFENGLTIDELNTKYLNGFTKNDFLYTTVHEISREFTNLHFEHFDVYESFFKEGYNTSFFEIAPKLLTIRENLYVQNLRANDIITLSFNGISLESIMNGRQANFSRTLQLELFSIQAQRVFVDSLSVNYLNNRSVHFEKEIFINDNHKIDTLKIPEFHVQSLEIEQLNGIEMNVLLQLKNLKSSDLSNIVIDGDLIVENLKVKEIEGQPSENFLKELAETDIQITPEKIESLTVENITLRSVYGQNFNNLISSVLLKSKEQVVSGHFSAHKITSNNITINFINQHNASQLMWIDESLTIIGNVTFSDLFVDGDIITSNLNGHDLHKLYDDLLIIPAKNIDILKVNGNVLWDRSSSNPNSISYLFENAVTKDSYQVITGKVTFDKDIHAWAVTSTLKEVNVIQNIISDVVIDCGKIIEISGKNIFEHDFVTDVLTVNGNIAIPKINDINILEFNDSVVRKEFKNAKIGPLIFLKEVKIEKLYTSDITLNASLSGAVRSIDVLPHNIFFEKLVVLDNVYLENFDGVYFDKFINNRVTLSGYHNISSDIRFNGLVTITDNADVKKINGICPSDFVLNEVDKVQVISDSKRFQKDLTIEGNVTISRINEMDVLKEYIDGVKNDEDVDIFGDLIFKANIRIREMDVSELVNGVNLYSIIDDLQENTNITFQSLNKQENIIKQNIDHSFHLSKTLHNIFLYLETEENVKIRAPNISKIEVMYVEKTTRLNMYGEQSGELCGLPSSNCSCLYQYIAELSDDNVKIWRKNSSGIVRNFHDPNNMFGINLMINTVSSSRECTRIKREFTKISFMTLNVKDSGETVPLVTNVPDEIEGYLKDAKIFKHNDDIYIVLAIYYNKTRTTHHANSLVYKVDLITRNVILIQQILTNGAWSIEIFKINNEIFLLIGCFGALSQSLLYKFDPKTSKFEQLRSFASRSRYVKNLSQGSDYFVLLDNPDTNALNIFQYNFTSGNFDNYQNIFYDHQINGIECFYADDFGDSDAFIIVTTQSGHFYIYEYLFAEKFQIKLQNVVNDLQTMMPFRHMNKQYIIAGTHNDSKIFRIIQQGLR